MGHAVAPSSCSVIHEDDTYLSFPAIARVGERLVAIFRSGQGNPLDFDARILITHSDDRGVTWSDPEVWVDLPGIDSRNCGGATLADGTAHFVFDLHSQQGWRRPYVRFSTDGRGWSEPVWLNANAPGGPEAQLTSIANQGLDWDEGRIYFPCFMGRSVLLDPKTGAQTQAPGVPRCEPAIAFNKRGELVACSKGGPVDISADRGRTWTAAGYLMTISQPDLIRLEDGRLLFCTSGKMRQDEWLLLSEDGHGVRHEAPMKIYEGTPDGRLDSRGKAMCIECDDEILTVLYEAGAPERGPSRIHLVRTPKDALR